MNAIIFLFHAKIKAIHFSVLFCLFYTISTKKIRSQGKKWFRFITTKNDFVWFRAGIRKLPENCLKCEGSKAKTRIIYDLPFFFDYFLMTWKNGGSKTWNVCTKFMLCYEMLKPYGVIFREIAYWGVFF